MNPREAGRKGAELLKKAAGVVFEKRVVAKVEFPIIDVPERQIPNHTPPEYRNKNRRDHDTDIQQEINDSLNFPTNSIHLNGAEIASLQRGPLPLGINTILDIAREQQD